MRSIKAVNYGFGACGVDAEYHPETAGPTFSGGPVELAVAALHKDVVTGNTAVGAVKVEKVGERLGRARSRQEHDYKGRREQIKDDANKSGKPHGNLLDGRGSGGEPFRARIESVPDSQGLDNVKESALSSCYPFSPRPTYSCHAPNSNSL